MCERSSVAEHQLPKLDTGVRFSSLAPFCFALLFTFAISGCATVPVYTPPTAIERPHVPGIYHKVEKGQTLWRISKFYNVKIEDIVRANRIPDAAQISVGQLLFIPNASKITAAESSFEKSDFIWPVKGKILYFYGSKKDGILNKGIDISTREGTDVVASRAGKVVFYDSKLKGYGKTLIVDHLDGFSTLYAYNSNVLVKAGDQVTQGQVIAKTGSSGRSKGTCLHFQIRKAGKPQNPFYFLPR